MRKRTYIIAAALLAVLAVGAHAAETRIYYLGNSLTDELKYDAFVKLAEADGEKVVWGRHMIPGVPIRGLWGAKGQGFQQGPFGHWDKALREFEWDVVTLQPFCPFQGEYEHALLFAQETMKKSPEARICIYAQWPGKGRHSDWDRAFSGPSEIPAWANQDTPTSYKNVAATVPEPLKSIPKQTLGTFFERQLTSADGNGIHRWKLKPSEKLPSGLTLDPNGRLWGAPGKRGLHRFAVTVDDGDPARPETAEQTFEVEVGPAASEIAVARRLTEKPKFDPEPDPAQWNFREPIRKLVEGTSATVAGDFDLAWDNEHFWVAVRIKDPTVGKGSWSDKLDRDNVILCLDMLNNREATYNADDRYIVYPRGHLYPQRSIMIGNEFSFGCRQKEIDGGYFALFQVNFRSFGLPPESLPNRVVGLDVMLVDDARQGTARSAVVWQGTKNNAADPSKFGTVVLEE